MVGRGWGSEKSLLCQGAPLERQVKYNLFTFVGYVINQNGGNQQTATPLHKNQGVPPQATSPNQGSQLFATKLIYCNTNLSKIMKVLWHHHLQKVYIDWTGWLMNGCVENYLLIFCTRLLHKLEWQYLWN